MWWEGVEERADAVAKGIHGALFSLSEQILELCEHLLDRVEVRTIGRQEQDPGTDGADRPAGRSSLVASQVVEDDDVARRERGNEELLDGEEAFFYC